MAAFLERKLLGRRFFSEYNAVMGLPALYSNRNTASSRMACASNSASGIMLTNCATAATGNRRERDQLQTGNPQSRIDGLVAKHKAIGAITTILANYVETDIFPVLEQALTETAQALGTPVGCLHLADGERGELNLVTGINLDPVQGHAWQRLKIGGVSLQAQVFDHGKVFEQLNGPTAGGMNSLVCAPVWGNQEAIGIISLIWSKPNQALVDPDRQIFLTTVGQLLGLALEQAGLVSELVDNLNQLMKLQAQEEERNRALAGLNEDLQKANRRLEELSITDGLTGLFNRRHLTSRLEREISRARRLDHPVSLVMADLDHFKRVNDQLGHRAGDQALCLFANLLANGLRQVDTVSRYGGEEFCMVLVNCKVSDGLLVAEKIRNQFVQNSKMEPFTALGGLTVSMGVAQLEDGMDPASLIEKADQALYQAKQSGRNRVEAAPYN
jgi:diguanylate cyclase (GGDEF)-like protein